MGGGGQENQPLASQPGGGSTRRTLRGGDKQNANLLSARPMECSSFSLGRDCVGSTQKTRPQSNAAHPPAVRSGPPAPHPRPALPAAQGPICWYPHAEVGTGIFSFRLVGLQIFRVTYIWKIVTAALSLTSQQLFWTPGNVNIKDTFLASKHSRQLSLQQGTRFGQSPALPRSQQHRRSNPRPVPGFPE